jgi:hypothetical protein
MLQAFILRNRLLKSRTDHQELQPLAKGSTMPPSALTTTTNSGGARQTVRRTNPTSATAKSPGAFTELVQTGL